MTKFKFQALLYHRLFASTYMRLMIVTNLEMDEFTEQDILLLEILLHAWGAG